MILVVYWIQYYLFWQFLLGGTPPSSEGLERSITVSLASNSIRLIGRTSRDCSNGGGNACHRLFGSPHASVRERGFLRLAPQEQTKSSLCEGRALSRFTQANNFSGAPGHLPSASLRVRSFATAFRELSAFALPTQLLKHSRPISEIVNSCEHRRTEIGGPGFRHILVKQRG